MDHICSDKLNINFDFAWPILINGKKCELILGLKRPYEDSLESFSLD